MTNLTRALGATTLAAAAALIAPAIASAHPVTVCTGPGGPETVNAQPYRGATVTSLTQNSDGTVTVRWTDGYTTAVRPAGACAPPPPVVVVAEPVTVAQPAPAPAPAPTCADLVARYPLAGPARRVTWGCPATSPKRTTPKPKPRPAPRVVTCSWARAHYSPATARAVLKRLGVTASCLSPYRPPVAG